MQLVRACQESPRCEIITCNESEREKSDLYIVNALVESTDSSPRGAISIQWVTTWAGRDRWWFGMVPWESAKSTFCNNTSSSIYVQITWPLPPFLMLTPSQTDGNPKLQCTVLNVYYRIVVMAQLGVSQLNPDWGQKFRTSKGQIAKTAAKMYTATFVNEEKELIH